MAADAEGQPPPPDTRTPGGGNDREADPRPAPRPARYGPLRVERHRKEDGRSLILYSLERDAAGG